MNPKVDEYIQDGCGRCDYYATPKCKVNTWRKELIALRDIALSTGLVEEIKWSMPCYTYNKTNVFIISAFKEFCSINFFKGVFLKDPENLLTKPGDQSQSSRFMKFTNVEDIYKWEDTIKAYIFEAIEVEKAGLKVSFKKVEDYPVPDELTEKFNDLPILKEAFENLTPGRQKAYLLFFNQAKQSKTRISRIEKFIPKILDGKGMHD